MTPRAKFLKEMNLKDIASVAWDALMLASNHDPDLESRISILERQMQRLGAPQYRTIYAGKKRKA